PGPRAGRGGCPRAAQSMMLATALLLAGVAALPYGPAAAPPAAAVLIHHGWDLPSPFYVRDHVRAMETLPFDGTTIRTRYGEGRVFGAERWDASTLEPEIVALEQ